MIEHREIADRAGVTLSDLNELLGGRATAKVAQQLRVPTADIQDFVFGSASATMQQRLGLNTLSAVDELAQAIGSKGAIGMLIGLLLSDSH